MSNDSKNTPVIEYHADDYALFPAQSRRILDCADRGVLNAVSVMTNSPYLKACMETLRPYKEAMAVAVHLNFMEGKAFYPGLLTDALGNFRVTFGALLAHSYLPGRGKYRVALRDEIRAQIHALLPYLEEGTGLRIDGHAHYHMLPVVFDALMDVVQEEKLNISYIRVPRDPLSLYLRHWRKLESFRFTNLVKVLVLDILTLRNQQKYSSFFSSLEQRMFLGVLFTGNMTLQNVLTVLPDAEIMAKRRGWGIEILAHPGGVCEAEDAKQLTHPGDLAFLTSDDRLKEADMFCKLKRNTGNKNASKGGKLQ